MNARQVQLCKALLSILNDRDGQMIETIIHAEMNLKLGRHIALTDIRATIELADTRGWLTGTEDEYRGKLWKINSAGRAALSEMP
jgi:hypothetical protein